MSELKQVIVVLVLFKKFTADRTVTKVAEPGQKVCCTILNLLIDLIFIGVNSFL